jgi:RNA polymerase sigma factor for flagellar operon FliA
MEAPGMTTDVPPPPSSATDGSHNGAVGSEFRLRELWRRHGEGDETARENLILQYAPLVKVVAGRVGSRLPTHVEQGDLISYGLAGLLGAIERYDPEHGAKFKTFALMRIRGAMIDALRSLDWVPRRVRRNARELEQVESGLGARLGRVPTEAELADGLGLELETLRARLLEIADSRLYSFDAPLPGRRDESLNGEASLLDVVPSHGLADPQTALDAAEEAGDLHAVLSEAIGDLPERQQFVLACRYREDLRLGEIGEVMGVSESRVSQLHTKALISLRAALGTARGPGKNGTLQLAPSWS